MTFDPYTRHPAAQSPYLQGVCRPAVQHGRLRRRHQRPRRQGGGISPQPRILQHGRRLRHQTCVKAPAV